jgi:LacI family transcriptional regulator
VTRGALRLFVEHGVPIAPSLSDYDRNHARHWEQAEAAATRAMGARLLELGHRRFVFVSAPGIKGRHDGRYRRGRWGALSTVLDSAGAEVDLVPIDPSRAEEITRDALRRTISEVAPTAVVCASHLLAPPVLMALAEAALDVPRDVSLVVYGDSDWARAHIPSLSVVAHDTYAEGYGLASALLDAIAGANGPRRAPIDAQYIERGSCGPARSG